MNFRGPFVILLVFLMVTNCSSNDGGSGGGSPTVTSYSTSLACGPNTAWPLTYQITTPVGWAGKKFAILMSGSPATQYFADQGPSENNFKTGLLSAGIKVLELLYGSAPLVCGASGTQDGFYAACCGAGWTNVVAHNSALYTSLVGQLGYNPKDSSQTLAGVGLSLGALQLEAMAFYSNNKFARVAMTGVLGGNFVSGCTEGQNGTLDGMSFYGFMSFADAITAGRNGCTQNPGTPTGFTSANNFDQAPFANASNLGLFEGDNNFLGAHQLQVNFIAQIRAALSAPVTTKVYAGCGHDAWTCSAGGFNLSTDILSFVNP